MFIRAVFSRTASLNMAATFKLFIINSPNGPILILYSDKALMEGEIGANGTLGPKQWQQVQSGEKRGERENIKQKRCGRA